MDELTNRVANHVSGGPQLLFFYSRSCDLCKALGDEVAKVGKEHKLSRICADQDQLWAPEMLAYSVEKVPCFVLLDKQGKAVARSGEPLSRQRMSLSLEALKQMADRLHT